MHAHQANTCAAWLLDRRRCWTIDSWASRTMTQATLFLGCFLGTSVDKVQESLIFMTILFWLVLIVPCMLGIIHYIFLKKGLNRLFSSIYISPYWAKQYKATMKENNLGLMLPSIYIKRVSKHVKCSTHQCNPTCCNMSILPTEYKYQNSIFSCNYASKFWD